MRFLVWFFCLGMLIGCAKDEAYLNPSFIKIYPDEHIKYSDYQIFGLKETNDHGFLVFMLVTENDHEPNHISVMRIDRHGVYKGRTYIKNINAYPTNIIDLGDDRFEFMCSPNPFKRSGTQKLVRVSVENDSVAVSTTPFLLKKAIENYLMIFYMMKQNGKYITLNVGIGRDQGREINQVYVHQFDTNTLHEQQQIRVQNFDATQVFGLYARDYVGLLEYQDIFFIQNVNGKLIYNAPKGSYMALSYLDSDLNNIYVSETYMLSAFTKNSTEPYFDLIFQDRKKNRSQATYLIRDFQLSERNHTSEIDSVLGRFKENAENVMAGGSRYYYHKIPNIDPRKKVQIRYNDENMFIGATSQTGRVLIHDFHQKKIHYFGSGNPQYQLSDWMISDQKMILVGVTELDLMDRNYEYQDFNHHLLLHGKRVPFMIITKF